MVRAPSLTLPRRPGEGVGEPLCFDPGLVAAETRIVARTALIDLLRVTHAPERIAEYQAAMQRGERFPPLGVVRIAGRLFVADGHKRLAACEQLGVDAVVVEVWTWRRWGRDQLAQLARKTRQQATLLCRAPWDAAARRQARRLFWDTVGHWRRIGASVWAILSRRA